MGKVWRKAFDDEQMARWICGDSYWHLSRAGTNEQGDFSRSSADRSRESLGRGAGEGRYDIAGRDLRRYLRGY